MRVRDCHNPHRTSLRDAEFGRPLPCPIIWPFSGCAGCIPSCLDRIGIQSRQRYLVPVHSAESDLDSAVVPSSDAVVVGRIALNGKKPLQLLKESFQVLGRLQVLSPSPGPCVRHGITQWNRSERLFARSLDSSLRQTRNVAFIATSAMRIDTSRSSVGSSEWRRKRSRRNPASSGFSKSKTSFPISTPYHSPSCLARLPKLETNQSARNLAMNW